MLFDSEKTLKLRRKYDKAQAAIDDICYRPADDPIWADQVFWDTKWIRMVDNMLDCAEQYYAASSKDSEDFIKNLK